MKHIVLTLQNDTSFAKVLDSSGIDIKSSVLSTTTDINYFLQMYFDYIVNKYKETHVVDKSIFNTIELYRKTSMVSADLIPLYLERSSIIELKCPRNGTIVVNKYSTIKDLRKNIDGLYIKKIGYGCKYLDKYTPLYKLLTQDKFVYDVIIN